MIYTSWYSKKNLTQIWYEEFNQQALNLKVKNSLHTPHEFLTFCSHLFSPNQIWVKNICTYNVTISVSVNNRINFVQTRYLTILINQIFFWIMFLMPLINQTRKEKIKLSFKKTGFILYAPWQPLQSSRVKSKIRFRIKLRKFFVLFYIRFVKTIK